MFEAKHNQSEQIVNFTTINDIIKAQVRTECGPFVIESLEKEVKSGPKESTIITKEDGTVTKIEEMKFRSKYAKYLNRVHKAKMQLNQTHSKYYVQINEEINGTLTKDQEIERAHQEKDLMAMRKLPRNINFNYRRSKEAIKSLWQADKDFINLKQ